jgi:hypothetical protein
MRISVELFQKAHTVEKAQLFATQGRYSMPLASLGGEIRGKNNYSVSENGC